MNAIGGQRYTTQMDTAFRNAHGFGYNELRSNQRLRTKVEKRREEDHQKGNIFAAQFKSHLNN